MTTVLNLSTGKEVIYTCEPQKAVLAAYAQNRRDWNTWNYQKKYGHLLEITAL